MRNISYALTEDQFLDGSKDITRRLRWLNLKAGDFLMGCRKCQGLKPGEDLVRLGIVHVVDVRREPLNRMSADSAYGIEEARREGFPHLSGGEFVEMFCRHMKCDPGQIITRIQFEHVRDLTSFISMEDAWFCQGCKAKEPMPLRLTLPRIHTAREAFRLKHLLCGRVERPVQ